MKNTEKIREHLEEAKLMVFKVLQLVCPKCTKQFPRYMQDEFNGHVANCHNLPPDEIESQEPTDHIVEVNKKVEHGEFTKECREVYGNYICPGGCIDRILDLCDRLDAAEAENSFLLEGNTKLMNSVVDLQAKLKAAEALTGLHDGDSSDCPTYYDGCNCTVETLIFNINRAEKAETKLKAQAEEIERLREVIEAALRISDLWTLKDVETMFEDEAKALELMKTGFEQALKEAE